MKHRFCRDFVGTNAGYWGLLAVAAAVIAPLDET